MSDKIISKPLNKDGQETWDRVFKKDYHPKPIMMFVSGEKIEMGDAVVLRQDNTIYKATVPDTKELNI